MALEQYSTLLSALEHVPDPRKARGKRYSWTLLLTIIVAGLASNYQTARASAHCARLHQGELHAALPDLVRSRAPRRCCAPYARSMRACSNSTSRNM